MAYRQDHGRNRLHLFQHPHAMASIDWLTQDFPADTQVSQDDFPHNPDLGSLDAYSRALQGA